MSEPLPVDALIEAARQWYDAGCCVIPSHENGSKRPFGRWKAYQHERMPWEELLALLQTGNFTGIGVITGAVSGNIELLEIEGPADVAMASLGRVKEVAEELGCLDLLDRLFPGCSSRSAGDGVHSLIHVTDGPALPNTKLATTSDNTVLAETRGEGGFVIVAPTPARNGHQDGSVYAFLPGANPANIPEFTSDERDRLHQMFTIALHAPEETSQLPDNARESSRLPHEPDATTPWGDFAARTSWHDILQPAGWQHVFTAPDGRSHWTRPGKNPADGISATTLDPGPLYVFSTSTVFPANQGLSKQAAYAHLHHGGDLKSAARALADAGYGTPTITPVLQPFTPSDQPNAIRERFPLVDWHELWADETEEEWIAEPLIPARRLIALYSAPKAGKSLLMLEIAAAIAGGRSVFGYPPGPPHRVLYVDFENDPRGDTRERLQAMDYTPDDLPNLCMLSFPVLSALDTEQGATELLAAIGEYDCSVVIIDTVSRSIQGEENENDTWLAFYRHTGLKLKQAGVALVRLDHSGKDESKGQRGGSAKSGDVDAIWRLKVTTDTRVDLECEASRFPIAEKHLTLRRDTHPLRHVATTDTYTDKVRELYEQMERHGVPKIADLTVRQMRNAIKDTGLRFDTSLVTSRFIADYVARTPTLHPLRLDTDD
jgi:hypothetical protein